MSDKFKGRTLTGEGAPRWLFARFVYQTVRRVVMAAYRVRTIGADNVPHGGAILAGNHISYLDPALLWCVSPRPTHFVAKSELWDVWWLWPLLERLWAFPVARGSADREMISTATRLLKAGELVAMFPEGTRNKSGDAESLGEAHGGVAYIAQRAGVPIVPVGIANTEKAWPKGQRLPRFPRVTIRFGEPIDPASFEGDRKECIEAVTRELMARVAEQRSLARGE